MNHPPREEVSERLGVAAALGAYIYWGLAPIYFKWIQQVPLLEIISHRLVWAVPILVLFLWYRDGSDFWRRLALPPRIIAGLFLSAVLVVGKRC